MEKKMWSIFGALSILSFLVSPVGQAVLKKGLTTNSSPVILTPSQQNVM